MGFMDRFRGGSTHEPPVLPTTSTGPEGASRTSRDAVLAPTPRDSITGNSNSNGIYDNDAVPYEQDEVNPYSVPGHNATTTTTNTASTNPTTTTGGMEVINEKPLPRQPLNGTVAGTPHAWTSNGNRRDIESGRNTKISGGRGAQDTTTTTTRKHSFLGRLFDRIFGFTTQDPFGPRPTITTWLKMYWGEIFTLFLLGMLSLGLLVWSPLPRFKYFPVYTDVSQSNLTPGDELVYPQFAAPKMNQHVPIVADALVAVFAPFIVVWLMNMLVVHSFWDVNNACIGTVVSVMTGCVVQIIIKLVVVGLRPHFLTVCDPMSPEEAAANGVEPKGGFGGLYYTVDVCRNKDEKKLANAMQSFPSGHSSAAWAGLFYLTLYLNGKLKPFSNYHPSWWKFLAIIAPMLAATLLVGSLTLDMSHNWYDIAVGSTIGVLVATGSYRMTYASVFDWRWSHVPLPRGNVYFLGETEQGRPLERGWVGARAMRDGYRKREGNGLGFSMEEMDMWSGYSGTRRGGWRRDSPTSFGAGGDSSAMWRSGGLTRSAAGYHSDDGRYSTEKRFTGDGRWTNKDRRYQQQMNEDGNTNGVVDDYNMYSSPGVGTGRY